MAEIRINATGGVKLYDADDSHYAQIIAGTITSNVDALTLGHASADFNIPVKVLGTTPTLTIGDAGAEDTKIVFDGNAQDFYIALDDSADDLLIGLGSTVGTTPAIAIDENLKVNIPVTTASTSASTGSLTTGGGAGIGADLYVGDDAYLITDSAVLGFGADKDTTLTHTDGTGLTLNSTNKLCFNDASQFVQGSSNAILSLGATDEIDLTATAVDLNGTLDVSGASQFNGAMVLAGSTPTLTIGDAGAEDTKIVFDGNAQDYYIGLDDTDDDFKIGLGSTVGTTAHVVIDETGAVTQPLQPTFMTKIGTMMESLGSSDTTIQFDTELWDVNGDFNTGTYTFTAPVTGKYYLKLHTQPHGLAATEANVTCKLVTSNNLWQFAWEPEKFAEAEFTTSLGFSIVADMDAADTAYCRIYLEDASGGDRDLHLPAYSNHFGGYLLG